MIRGSARARRAVIATVAVLVAVLAWTAAGLSGLGSTRGPSRIGQPATPVRHLVVIYDENVSFDHYFATYPHAANPPGQPGFTAAPGTPAVAGLSTALLTHNPNGANPHRLGPAQAVTCDNDHSYRGEQVADDHGRMDRFPHRITPQCPTTTLDYYDGNTVTALWNYAQRFAMSDHFFEATFGPSLLGHLNLVAGQTMGVTITHAGRRIRTGALTANVPSALEQCTRGAPVVAEMSGRNIGDLLSAAGVSWGWFSGGFRPTGRRADGTPICGAEHRNRAGVEIGDYTASGVTEPFQYWASTANPAHTAPRSVAEIGHAGPANHQYDLTDFWAAADSGRLPAVSFLKPPVYANGHAELSDPLTEQAFLVDTLNRLQALPTWPSTAVVVTYDDSDGWYDHLAAAITNPSSSLRDQLTGPGQCGRGTPLAGLNGRCGPGPRLPLLIISPWARRDYVDHTVTTQVSILRFIEDNWLAGERIGGGSFDATAAPLTGLFEFGGRPDPTPLRLIPSTGERLG